MCGIAAAWGRADDETIVRAIMDDLVHRGPDASGSFSSARGTGVLGHRRLSIMDPGGGHQPIRSGDGRRAVIANGEIYNFPDVRPELEVRHRFRSLSDSEAILHLYEELGREAVEHLDGMWAFALADAEELFVARDPLGIKPLYMGRRNGSLVFASELKALAGRADQICEFPPGTSWHSTHGWERFYEVPEPPVEEDSVEGWCSRLRAALDDCVAKQRMSDVPVGAFLSGGLDSSILAALLRRHADELHTFSVGLEGSGDLAAARVVAEHLDTIHHEHVLTREEIAEALPAIVWHLESFDQDLVRSAVPSWFTARLAREYVTVALTGEGADELFAGYAYHAGIDDHDTLRDELRRSVEALHDVNLQRVDRMTMAHSLEGRPPFLDDAVIDLAGRIPTQLKLPEEGKEKWILRVAFQDLLPEAIVWRKKEQFDQGSGVDEVAAQVAGAQMSEEQARAYRERWPDVRLRSAEECFYHHLLTTSLEHPEPVLDNVARWTDRPAGVPG
ncbi:MAG: asparagine synthase B [Actinomycetota bacterium]|nr:asparagine synthase B [Actinomycetota bacterium]